MEKPNYVQVGDNFVDFLMRICKENNIEFTTEEAARQQLAEKGIEYEFRTC